MAEKLTIRDIARLAGVSATTVSRVLNDKPDVDPLTRARVMQVMKERGFSPDPLAVQLAGGPLHKNQYSTPVFPTNFFWGMATSAYQVEGATREDGRGPSIWDTFACLPDATYKGETGDIATDHYHHMQEDIVLPRLRSYIPQAHIGISLNLTPVSAADDNAITLQGVEHADVFHNCWFLDPLFRGVYPQQLFDDMAVEAPSTESSDMTLISAPLDFLGVNYYSRSLIRSKRNARTNGSGSVRESYEQVAPVPGATYTEMAWEIYPRGVQEVLLRVYQDYAPPLILITENGAAFDDQWDGGEHIADKRRVLYLREHIQMLEKVLKRGVPLRSPCLT